MTAWRVQSPEDGNGVWYEVEAGGDPAAGSSLTQRRRTPSGTLETWRILSPEAVSWLASGERGLSSNAVFQRTTGVKVCRDSCESLYPLDPDDLSRCVRLLEDVPEARDGFAGMRDAGPEWAALVDAWPALVGLLDDEVPGWRGGARGNAPRCYALMRECRSRAS